MATILQARNEILGSIKTVTAASALFNDIVICWPDIETEIPETNDDAYVVVSIEHMALGGAATINTATYRRFGVATCQLFTPLGDGLNSAYNLSTILLTAFEGVHTANGVWFRTSGLTEVGQVGKFHQINVVGGFEYFHTT